MTWFNTWSIWFIPCNVIIRYFQHATRNLFVVLAGCLLIYWSGLPICHWGCYLFASTFQPWIIYWKHLFAGQGDRRQLNTICEDCNFTWIYCVCLLILFLSRSLPSSTNSTTHWKFCHRITKSLSNQCSSVLIQSLPSFRCPSPLFWILVSLPQW